MAMGCMVSRMLWEDDCRNVHEVTKLKQEIDALRKYVRDIELHNNRFKSNISDKVDEISRQHVITF